MKITDDIQPNSEPSAGGSSKPPVISRCGLYNLVYADPPWKYDNKRIGRDNKHGAEQNYLLTENNDLKILPINDITQNEAVCFMWVTVPMMREGFDLLSAWGFEYKTFFTWEKTGGLGMGRWLRVQTEHVLIGVKGKVKPFGFQEKNIYKHPISAHSQKPHFFRELIVKMASKSFDRLDKLEMFARTRDGMFGDYEYEGWSVYGDEVNGSINLKTGSNGL